MVAVAVALAVVVAVEVIEGFAVGVLETKIPARRTGSLHAFSSSADAMITNLVIPRPLNLSTNRHLIPETDTVWSTFLRAL
jgi:hypothetical protein